MGVCGKLGVVLAVLVAAMGGVVEGAGDISQFAQLLGLIPPNTGLVDVVPGLEQVVDAYDNVREGLAIAGIIVVKIAVFIGFIYNYTDQILEGNEIINAPPEEEAEAAERYSHHYGRYKRAIAMNRFGNKRENIKRTMASTVAQMDSHGCLKKLLCHFNNKHPLDLDPEESLILHLFGGNLPESEEDLGCNERFQDCPVDAGDLGILFSDSWEFLNGALG